MHRLKPNSYRRHGGLRSPSAFVLTGIAVAVWFASGSRALAQSEYPPHSKVLEGFEKVVSTAPGDEQRTMYTIWTREKDNQMYAELPSGYKNKKYFIALTVASGGEYAGLQAGELYVYWKEYNNRLALLTPNVEFRSTGDRESKASVERLFTDKVILEVPIVTRGPGGGPVIDMDDLLVSKAQYFFGSRIRDPKLARLYSIKKAKSFPENVELAFEVPSLNGRLQTLHYSISEIKPSPGYKPRKADERVGYFTTSYKDLGIYSDEETRVRYINRWHLEKADKKLKLSPPKQPITFYIEHTTPVRYRRWVKAGVLAWNKAFEKVGLIDAIQVEVQDPTRSPETSYMDRDPEDVRYNFIRWLNNDRGVAIGPSRVDPMTGEILDADIILTDGWIRHFRFNFEDLMPDVATQGFHPETMAWLSDHPEWDPRIRLAHPSQREHLKARFSSELYKPYAGHPVAEVDPVLIGDNPFDGLVGRTSQINGLCTAAEGHAFDVALMRMHMRMARLKDARDADDGEDKDGDEKDGENNDEEEDKEKDEEEKDEKEEEDEKETMIDGMPESFIGPLLAQLVAHEVGHTLGLRHNFKASSIYSLEEINSQKIKDQKPFSGSVMDYNPVNIHMEAGEIQGDYAMSEIGPYDYWAIEFGYTFDKNLDPILERVAEPELRYATDEDTYGPDPLARRYDFSSDPLEYAVEQMRLARYHREHLIEDFVEEGESWAKARRGYEMTLHLQTRSLNMMANWLGGAYVHRDKKGDKNARVPIEVVPTEKQREALDFVLKHAFRDQAYGLTPELLNRMSMDKWLDGDFWLALQDSTWPVHDRILGIQSAALTMLMNPTTLRRAYDNESRVPSEDDALTLPELLEAITSEIWSELDSQPKKEHTARSPMISSLRRNLQREHLKRLIDLSLPGAGSGAAYKPISNLSLTQLRKIRSKAAAMLQGAGDKLDPYTEAHLTEVEEQIAKALDSQYIYNTDDLRGGGGVLRLLLNQQQRQQAGETVEPEDYFSR